jgi:serine/threonine-protein kinase
MGKVFRAKDEKLEETVVIKVAKPLLDDPKLLEHFKREIRLARKITHPGVVRIFDFWEAGPLYFVTMEWLEGSDLRSEVKRRGPFPIPVAMRIGIQLFDGLAAAHEVGVVHRDIKPHNVVMLSNGHIKVLDFGIAQALDQRTGELATATTGVVGTPEYMSPEQILGDRVDERTDLYSSGALLYELLTGDIPLRGENRMATASLHLRVEPPPPSSKRPEVPAALDDFVLTLLKKDRDLRPATALEAARQLRTLLG